MLKKLINCRAYADLNKCVLLLEVLNAEYRSFLDLKTYFSNDIIIITNLEDTLKLFEALGYIVIDEDDSIKNYKSIDIEYSQELIIKDIIDLLVKNKVCELIRIDLDFYIQIQQEFYALRNLLALTEAIVKSHINRYYRIESIYSHRLINRHKKTSKAQFLKRLTKQAELGELAEKYVLELEDNRFNSLREIKHIALEDNNAGYDIMSFIDDESNNYDKFIEVKCYSDSTRRFFISRNEITQSKKLGQNYYLYLVDSKFDSHPIIIRDPFSSIFSNSEVPYEIENISYNIDNIVKTSTINTI